MATKARQTVATAHGMCQVCDASSVLAIFLSCTYRLTMKFLIRSSDGAAVRAVAPHHLLSRPVDVASKNAAGFSNLLCHFAGAIDR